MMTSLPIELFDDNFPFLAMHAKQEYDAAKNPIPARGKRVFNDILSKIRDRASEGRMQCSAHRFHANSISYIVKPLTLRERWKAYWSDSDYSPYGLRISMNDADLKFVIDSLVKCGYNVNEHKTFGASIDFTVSWDS